MTDANNANAFEMHADLKYARLVALFGGPEGLVQHMQRRQKDFSSVWEQDSVELGQVLHAHLVVEFFLTEYLKHLFPTIDLDKLGLRYGQKVRMLPTGSSFLSSFLPGLNALGSIRNKVAHVRRVQISKDDVQPMSNVAPYRMLIGVTGTIDFSTATPLEVVLSFAQFTAGTLHSASDQEHEKWATALDPTKPIPGFERFLPPAPSDGVPGVGRPGMFG
jgi:hypothetical protein